MPSSNPIVILILNNDGIISYQAFLPKNYDNSDPNQMDSFLSRVYNHISYDHTNALNNHTSLGKLLEVHHRHILIPLSQNPTSYFFTYINHHCNYKPIHVNSPIVFDSQDALAYSDAHPDFFLMNSSILYV